MPYIFYLGKMPEDDIELRVRNLDNFYFWCASRILTPDREYAKEILNSIGATQGCTDRKKIAIVKKYMITREDRRRIFQ